MYKTWADKERDYEARYSSHRITRNIWKYIPDYAIPAIESAEVDSDGYWICLEDGWTSRDGDADCSVIHCYTISDMIDDIRTIRKK